MTGRQVNANELARLQSAHRFTILSAAHYCNETAAREGQDERHIALHVRGKGWFLAEVDPATMGHDAGTWDLIG